MNVRVLHFFFQCSETILLYSWMPIMASLIGCGSNVLIYKSFPFACDRLLRIIQTVNKTIASNNIDCNTNVSNSSAMTLHSSAFIYVPLLLYPLHFVIDSLLLNRQSQPCAQPCTRVYSPFWEILALDNLDPPFPCSRRLVHHRSYTAAPNCLYLEQCVQ
jgi:hypothetical protein